MKLFEYSTDILPKNETKKKTKTVSTDLSLPKKDLFSEIVSLIEQSKANVQIYANSTLTLLYWRIGKRINDDILQNKQAEYGKQIVSSLSTQLTEQYRTIRTKL